MGLIKAVKRLAIGSNQSDTIIGSALGDTLKANGGNDTIKGFNGADKMLGGSGNDKASGGAGNDKIDGGAGHDKLFGDSGNDTIAGGSSNDMLVGGGGNDTLTGGAGNDTINGGGGTDTAVFSGNLADYDFSFVGVNVIVTHARGTRADGRDTVLASVERLKFADQTIDRPLPDTTAPTATISVADTSLKIGEATQVTITFSEAVTGLTLGDLTIEGGTLAAPISSDGGKTWTATFTPNSDLEDSSNVITLANPGVVDLAGNAGAGTTTSNTYAVDTLAPIASISISPIAGDNRINIAEGSGTIAITGTAGGDVMTGDTVTLTINGSTFAGPVVSGGFSIDVPAAALLSGSDLTVHASVTTTDLAGNSTTETDTQTYLVDQARPTATINVAGSALKAGETTTVTITFSEAVTGLAVGDFTVDGGSLSELSSSNGGLTWTAKLTPNADLEDASNVITLLNTGVADLAGNAGSGTTASNNYAIDTLAPDALTVGLETDSGAPDDLITNDGTLSVSPQEPGAIIQYSIDGTNWGASYSVNEGTNNIQVRQVDDAGNASAGTSLEFTLDTMVAAPTLSITQTQGTHSYPIAPNSWLTLTGVESGASIELSSDGNMWSSVLPPIVEGSNTIYARQTDVTGNLSASSNVVQFDYNPGLAVDGYIAGATVFADADDDGMLDAGEVFTTTDAGGNFVLIGGTGKLVLQGGTDISTGLAFTGQLSAPDGSTTVTPLTTLVVAIADATGGTTADAEALVISALGLSGLAVGLGDYDPIAAALSPDAAEAAVGADAVTAAIALQNTIAQTAALLAGAGANQEAAEAAALAAIADAILDNPSTPINLSDSATIGDVIAAAAGATGATSLTPETIDGATSVITATNALAEEANAAGGDPLALLSTLAQLQIVIENEVTGALTLAGETNDTTSAVASYTGANLNTVVDAAAVQLGDVDGADVGDAGDNTMVGTAGIDVIFGEGGDDTLEGLGGNDTLQGGAGIDTYVWSQGDGFDTVVATGGGPNEDIVQINGAFYDYNWEIQGNDLLIGVTADDSYVFSSVGGALRLQNFFTGTDTFSYLEADFGSEFNQFYNPNGGLSRIYFSFLSGTNQGDYYEVVIGTSTGDSMTGGGGYLDKFWGLDGNDAISVSNGTIGLMRGGRGDDILTGADQNDQLVGGSGDDTIDGGTGYDVVTYNHFFTNDAPLAQGVFVNLSGDEQTRMVNGTSVTLQMEQARDNWGEIDTLLNIEEVRGSNNNDTLVGSDNGDVLKGLGGIDTLEGGGGDDTLSGDAGDDTLTGGSGTDTYVWSQGDGFDTVVATGSAANEDIVQINGTFYDYSWEIQGNDLLIGVAADGNYDFNDVGGALRIENFFLGSDTINYLEADLGNFNEFYNPSGGPSRIYFSHSSGTDQGVYYEVVIGSSSNDLMTGGGGDFDKFWGLDGNDTISVSNGTIGHMRGGRGDDTLTGADQNDHLVGGSGNDTMDGGTGYDVVTYNHFFTNDAPPAQGVFVNLSGSAQTRTVNGDSITLQAGQAQDNWGEIDTLLNIEEVRGSNNNDTLVGSDNGDVLKGLGGIDALEGGAGNDDVQGNEGNDVLLGGGGEDIIRAGLGSDTIDGGEGNDTLFAESISGATIVALADGTGTVSFANGDLDTFQGIESIWGSNLGDVIDLSSGSGVIQSVAGFAGDDIIIGSSFDDSMTGNEGSDTLTGGDGSDMFDVSQWAQAGDTDTITDFTDGEDLLGLDHFGFANADEALQYLSQDGADLIFSFAGATVIIQNFQLADFTAADLTNFPASENDILTGTFGNDTLSGGDGDDFIDGLAGDDMLSGDAGNDRLIGRGGDDLLDGGDGDDELSAGLGVDVLLGGDGNDVLEGGEVSTLIGGAGDDLLLGGIEAGTYEGGDGNDVIYAYGETYEFIDEFTEIFHGSIADAGAGDDLVIVGPYATVTLGEGSDVVRVGPYQGSDQTVTDFSVSDDKVDLSRLIQYVTEEAFYFGTPYWDGTGNPFGTYLNIVQDGANTLIQVLHENEGFDPVTGEAVFTTEFNTVLTLVGVDASTLTTANFSPAFAPDGSAPGVGVTLSGTIDADTLLGSVGGDTIDGGDGDDVIDGSFGNDTLSGGTGDDQIDGSFGNDEIDGGTGNDWLLGGRGDDTLIGGDGDDVLEGNQGSNILDGGAGNDTLTGGGFKAGTYLGGEGNDVIHASGVHEVDQPDGTEIVFYSTADAGAGDDVVYAGDGAIITLGAGFDRVVASATFFEQPSVMDFNAAEDKVDLRQVIEYITESAFYQSVPFWDGEGNPFGPFLKIIQDGANTHLQVLRENEADFTTEFRTVLILVDVDSTTLTVDNFAPAFAPDGSAPGAGQTISGTIDPETLSGTVGGDTINGGDGGDMIDGSFGNDTLNGEAGDDQIEGGFGNDVIDGGTGNDLIAGGRGNDTLIGGEGDDVLEGNEGSNTLDGGAGDDTLWGGTRAGTYFGGEGNDFIAVSGYSVTDLPDGTEMFTYSTADAGAGDDIVVVDGGAQATLGAGADTFMLGVSGYPREAIITDFTIGEDKIDLANVLDYIADGFNFPSTGGWDGIANPFGHYIQFEQDGADTLISVLREFEDFDPDTGETIYTPVLVPVARLVGVDSFALSSDDFVQPYSPDGLTVIGGTEEADTLIGTAGPDGISGLGGDDVIAGLAGGDFIAGDAGNDVIHGGSGDDKLVLDGAGAITINLTSGGTGSVTFANGEMDVFDGIEGFWGSTDEDTIVTLSAAPGAVTETDSGVITGAVTTHGGNDQLIGSDQADSLSGGAGDDIITGGSGDDQLGGQDGTDQLIGGDGNDVFSGWDGSDTIDGGAGDDRIELRDAASGGAIVNITSLGAGTSTYANGDIDTFVNIEAIWGTDFNDVINLGAGLGSGTGGSFAFVNGGEGDDQIVGSSEQEFLSGEIGDDVLTGGGGFDIFNANYSPGLTASIDIIMDFIDGEDLIAFGEYGFADAAEALSHFTDVAGDAVFTFLDATVVIKSTNLSQLSELDIMV